MNRVRRIRKLVAERTEERSDFAKEAKAVGEDLAHLPD